MASFVSSNNILPMNPGYGIGSVIREDELLFPILIKQKTGLSEELIHLQTQSDRENDRSQLAYLTAAKNKVKNRITEVEKQVEKRQKSFESTYIEEPLQIDETYSQVRVEKRSFPSEKMSYLVLNRDEAGGDQAKKRIEEFAFRLFSSENASGCFSKNALEGVIEDVKRTLKTRTQVTLLGSFITLPQVKLMNPVVLREGTRPSDELVKNAERYYVLTEAVLGAAFLGFGQSLSNDQESTEPLEGRVEVVASKASMSSFISQGAIPKVEKHLELINLWSVYTSWKESLSSDLSTGYPVGFKYRRLDYILRENGIK